MLSRPGLVLFGQALLCGGTVVAVLWGLNQAYENSRRRRRRGDWAGSEWEHSALCQQRNIESLYEQLERQQVLCGNNNRYQR